MQAELGRPPELAELADRLGMQLERVERIEEAMGTWALSLHGTTSCEGHALEETIPNERAEVPGRGLDVAVAHSSLGRAMKCLEPMELDILRKRLFTKLPDRAEIADIASAYGRKLAEAAKAKTTHRGAEAIADEIVATYPFHPRLKNVVALFVISAIFGFMRGRSPTPP